MSSETGLWNSAAKELIHSIAVLDEPLTANPRRPEDRDRECPQPFLIGGRISVGYRGLKAEPGQRAKPCKRHVSNPGRRQAEKVLDPSTEPSPGIY
jgi:hypothetical protein